MRNIVKYIGISLLITGLAACDGQKDNQKTKENNTTASSSAVSVPAGETVSLFDGKAEFTLPAGLTDQTGKLGTQSNSMHVYADKTGQQAVIVILAPMPQEDLKTLSTRLVEQQKSRDPSLKLLSDDAIKVGNADARKVVSTQMSHNNMSYSSIVLAHIGNDLLTIQTSLPASNQEEAAKVADGVISTLKVKE